MDERLEAKRKFPQIGKCITIDAHKNVQLYCDYYRTKKRVSGFLHFDLPSQSRRKVSQLDDSHGSNIKLNSNPYLWLSSDSGHLALTALPGDGWLAPNDQAVETSSDIHEDALPHRDRQSITALFKWHVAHTTVYNGIIKGRLSNKEDDVLIETKLAANSLVG